MFAILKVARHVKVFNSVRFQWSQPQRKSPPYTKTITSIPVFKRARDFAEREAVQDNGGKYLYGNILLSAHNLAKEITRQCDGQVDQRVLFLCPNDVSYLITQWAIWMSGQIAVPLGRHVPEPLLLHLASDIQAKLIITNATYAPRMQTIAKSTRANLLVLDSDLHKKSQLRGVDFKGGSVGEGLHPVEFYENRDALIVYTSGTTAKPKGVVLTHTNLTHQIVTLVDAWQFDAKDNVLHTLPLNHVHGIVNALLVPLYAGGKCILLADFDVTDVWSTMLGLKEGVLRPSVFMGVPTMYVKLIEHYGKIFKTKKIIEHIHATLKTRVRLMISGSAPLPHTVHRKWETISGHRLLERYGMTEIGMCLSQLYESKREAGNVGLPLTNVAVRLVEKPPDDEGDYLVLVEARNEGGDVKIDVAENLLVKGDPMGELQVKTSGLFREYFNQPQRTRKEFTLDGWFKTGDMCKYSREKRTFAIMGRTSVDIIKSGGYKVSAIEVESNLLNHPEVRECAAVGVADDTYGQVVGVALVVQTANVKEKFDVNAFVAWTKKQLPAYSIPRKLIIVDELPKNELGKVNKREVIGLFLKKD